MDRRVDIAAELERLYAARDAVTFAENAVAMARSLFPSAVITWHEVAQAPRHHTRHLCHDVRATHAVSDAWRRFSLESPVVRYYLAGGVDPVINTEELVADRVIRGTGLYAECWRPFGVKYQIGLRLWGPGRVQGLSIKRDRRFAAGDVALLLSVFPHLRRALKLAEAAGLKPGPPQLAGLTRRENEILGWVSAGKRDAEIASILGIATRTVNKHVERILEKLGVETRTAAASTVFEHPAFESAPR